MIRVSKVYSWCYDLYSYLMLLPVKATPQLPRLVSWNVIKWISTLV